MWETTSLMNKKFDSETVYGDNGKYINTKIESYGDKANTNFQEKKKLNGIKVRVFFRKIVEKKHLCRHDKNRYYFQKSNIPVINLIMDSRNMIKVSKSMRL